MGKHYILVVFAVLLCGASIADASTNVALNKPTTQSSLWPWGEASKAVDGNPNGDWSAGSMSHTQLDAQAWWQVDLGAPHSIQAIQIWSRADCCAERLSNFYVLVSDVPFGSTSLQGTLAQAGVGGYYTAGTANILTILPVNRTGRYVRVQLANADYLSLADVQVMAAESAGSGPIFITVNGNAGAQTMKPGDTAVAKVENWPGDLSDCVGLYHVGAGVFDPAVGISYMSASTVPFPLPATPGTYEFRYFQRCTLVQKLATSAVITVGAPRVRTLSILKAGSGNGTVGPPTGQHPVGESVALTQEAYPGSVFTGWSDTSGLFGCRSGTVVMPDNDITCTAFFSLLRTVSVIVEGPGTVEWTSAQFEEGAIVTLPTTTPATGATFAGWKDTSGPYGCVSGRFAMPADSITCTAMFSGGEGSAGTWHPYVGTTHYVFSNGEIHNWCGVAAWIQVPNPLPDISSNTSEYFRAYVSVNVGSRFIRVGIARRGDKFGGLMTVWHSDPEYPDTSLPLFLSPGQWIYAEIGCCVDQTGYNIGEYWYEAYRFPNAVGKSTDITYLRWPLFGSQKSDVTRQEMEVHGVAGTVPAVPPVSFSATNLLAFDASAPAQLYCKGYHSIAYWTPAVAVPAGPPHDDQPYDQHWSAPYNAGYMHKH